MQQEFPGSELEKLIARFRSQKACLDLAARLVADLEGPILDLGLGKGRTFDHLRRLFPNRSIFAFDLVMHAPEHCRPSPNQLILGDFLETLVGFEAKAGPAALVHADIGSRDRAADAQLAAKLAPLIDQVVLPGAVILSDRPLESPGWYALEPPLEAGVWPYFMRQVGGDRLKKPQ
ncbi:MAG: class I SAM-dependent methyltransferase [Pseudomonadota bacterium]